MAGEGKGPEALHTDRVSGRLNCDVLIVGLGPAGASAAKSAAKAGAHVIAIDRRATPGLPVQCAEFVPTLLGQSTDAIVSTRTQAIDGMVTFLPGARDEQSTFHGTMIDRRAFDAALVDAARAAGVDCRLGVSLRAIDSNGQAILSTGDVITTSVIIGADGPRSMVGAAIGQTNTKLAETRQIVVPLLKSFATTDIFLSPDIVGGYAWLFPRGDIANLGLGVDASQRALLKPLLEDLRQQLVARGRISDEIIRHTGGAIPVGGALDVIGRCGQVHILLAGDAAGLTNPITGAGIASAVQSGLAAGAAAARLAHGDSTACDDYTEDIDDLFHVSLARAASRRDELMAIWRRRRPRNAELERGWIAFPSYWAPRAPAAPSSLETATHVMP